MSSDLLVDHLQDIQSVERKVHVGLPENASNLMNN